MLTRWRWVFDHLTKRLWVRATLFAVLGVAAALLAVALAPIIPVGLSHGIGADAVENILEILASSMLIVATFSLSTMLAAYATAASGTTPRVVQLLRRDTRAQNALGVFVGGFLFSLVGIIALSAGLYSDDSRLVLFVFTILVVGVIVMTLLRWIELLAELGRVEDAVDRVAGAAMAVVTDRRDNPFLGGRARGSRQPPPHPVRPAGAGYVNHLDMAALQEVAAEHEGEIHVEALPGKLVDASGPIAWLSFPPDEAATLAVRQAFSLGARRTLEQDPRFCLVVLSEIATKALSPGVNDPGTAIEVMAALVRVLSVWAAPAEEPGPTPYPNVFVPTIGIDDIFDDAFSAISRYGAGHLDVAIRLQKALAVLSRLGNGGFEQAARRLARLALARSRAAMAVAEDVAELEKAAVLAAAAQAA